jgi:hypothetical protein
MQKAEEAQSYVSHVVAGKRTRRESCGDKMDSNGFRHFALLGEYLCGRLNTLMWLSQPVLHFCPRGTRSLLFPLAFGAPVVAIGDADAFDSLFACRLVIAGRVEGRISGDQARGVIAGGAIRFPESTAPSRMAASGTHEQ